MAKVIAVANQKGGCSKTSVVTNLSIGLAMEGKRVCVIDADPQGSLTASLGYPERDLLERGKPSRRLPCRQEPYRRTTGERSVCGSVPPGHAVRGSESGGGDGEDHQL